MKRIALIGMGKMGLSHLAIANNTPGIEVAAICDTSLKLSNILKRYWPINIYCDYKSMLNEIEVDAVIISTPNSTHYSIAKHCIKNRKHIFIEKPFTIQYDHSNELISLARQYDVKGQVGYVNRFNPIFKYLKDIIVRRVIGKVENYYNEMIGAVITKEESKGWRNNYSKGGGCLFDYGPHCFDLSIFLFGENVEVKTSSIEKRFSSNVHDIVRADLIHNNSIKGINYINWSRGDVRKAENIININGSGGSIKANKQEIILELDNSISELNLQKGINNIYSTDLSINLDYYLRGEEFSLQMIEFSRLINNDIESSISNLVSASISDKCIADIIKQNHIKL